MTFLGGLAGAAVLAILSLLIMVPATDNLGSSRQLLALAVAVLSAVVIGFLTGSSVFRRAAARRRNLGLFSSLAGGFGCGLVGAIWMLVLLVSYMTTYGTWPPDVVDQVLTVVAFPALALFGFTLGALAGSLSGLVAGGLLGVVLPARR